MTLGARLLDNVFNVNAYDTVQELRASKGSAFPVNIQLIDKGQHTAQQGHSPSGLRYMPDAGATLSMEVVNINPANTFSRVATQPYAQDPSIWKANFLTSDPIPSGTLSIKVTLTEGAIVRTFVIVAALRVDGGLEVC